MGSILNNRSSLITDAAGHAKDISGRTRKQEDGFTPLRQTGASLIARKVTERAQQEAALSHDRAPLSVSDIHVLLADTEDQVADLREALAHIGKVTTEIRIGAKQTNLLTQNTSVETARAEHGGEGFAMAASEVGTLLNKTAEATAEINATLKALNKQAQILATALKAHAVNDDAAIGGGVIYRSVTPYRNRAMKPMRWIAPAWNARSPV